MKTFKEMEIRAKTVDYARDKKRSESADKSKRYEVCSFPAYHGSPIRTNIKFIALIVAICRTMSYAETKIIDHKTEEYTVL